MALCMTVAEFQFLADTSAVRPPGHTDTQRTHPPTHPPPRPCALPTRLDGAPRAKNARFR